MTDNIIYNAQLEQYRQQNTRSINIGNGETRDVLMPPDLWKELEFVTVIEGVSTAQLADWAAEEVELQDNVSFDQAFRAVVTYITNLWTP